jgi:hypothetical protein
MQAVIYAVLPAAPGYEVTHNARLRLLGTRRRRGLRKGWAHNVDSLEIRREGRFRRALRSCT